MKIKAIGTAGELDVFKRLNSPYIRGESKLYATPHGDIYRRHFDIHYPPESVEKPLIAKVEPLQNLPGCVII